MIGIVCVYVEGRGQCYGSHIDEKVRDTDGELRLVNARRLSEAGVCLHLEQAVTSPVTQRHHSREMQPFMLLGTGAGISDTFNEVA